MQVLGYEMMSRGRDASGMLTVIDGNVNIRKQAAPAIDFFKENPGIGAGARLILGHTRAATQGDARFERNNHPVVYGDIAGVHNGVIFNDYDLFADNKWKRIGEVDSEAIFAALHQKPTVKAALEDLEGWLAIGWVDWRDPHRLWLAKGQSSPLFTAMTKGGSMFFASEASALRHLAVYKMIPDEDWVSIDQVVNEGTIISYDPDVDAQPVTSQYTPAYTYWGTSTSTYHPKWNWDWQECTFRSTAKRDKANVAQLATIALGAHHEHVDDLRDPFDDDDEPAGFTVKQHFAEGDRVVSRQRRIGTVMLADNGCAQSIIEWDPSIETHEDLAPASSREQEESQHDFDRWVGKGVDA